MLTDEDGVVREQGWVEGELDTGDVEATVLGERVIAIEEKCNAGECHQYNAHGPGRKKPG